jgi:hypothetical protein
MSFGGFMAAAIPYGKRCRSGWLLSLACLVGFLSIAARAHARQELGADPTGFFTNVAARLLSSELNLPLSHIQVYPTNEYTPAVHRLLQLAANLYDATTNRSVLTAYPYLPSVFRPLFRRDTNGAVWIAGYREVTDARMADAATAPMMVDLENDTNRLDILPAATPFDPDDQNEPMVYGMPLVIGAKKGFPNFNQFGLDTAVTATRTLVLRRLDAWQPVSQTNQMCTLGISNVLRVQAWNSYTSTFSRPLLLSVAVNVMLALTNESGAILGPDGVALSRWFQVAATTNLPANAWTGFSYLSPVSSFQVPLLAGSSFLSSSAFRHQQNRFVTAPFFESTGHFPVPNWWLSASVRLRFALVDTSVTPNRIVDYVNLASRENPLNVMAMLRGNGTGPCDLVQYNTPTPDPGILWCTNRIGGSTDEYTPTFGIHNQFLISLGLPVQVSDTYWRSYNASPVDPDPAIHEFRQSFFMMPGPLMFETPFNPKRTFHHYVSWQVNDPLVHHMVPHLIDLLGYHANIEWDSNGQSPVERMFGEHYRPWGGNPYYFEETYPKTQFNRAVKDPSVCGPDDWTFPGGEPLSFAMLGRVHRGSPWQTVYLKSEAVAPATWMLWSGDTNHSSALATLPTNDWHLVSQLDPFLNTNHPGQRLSLNEPATNAWLGLLDGMPVLTNSAPFEPEVVIMSSNSPQAALIAGGIRQTRARQPGQYFRNLGDILATPALSTASPWLNTNMVDGLTDEAYERIPAQLLSLLRTDSVGSISASNGQAVLQFSGYDDFPYAIESSSNLVDWIGLGASYPTGGVFSFELPIPGGTPSQFYRSVLLP